MDISAYVKKFARKRNFGTSMYTAETVRSLLIGEGSAALINQDGYKDSNYLDIGYLNANIKSSVRKYSRNKNIAIHIYKDFLKFLKQEGVEIEEEVDFPTIDVSNSFERLMYIAKDLQNPNNSVSSLEDKLWVSQRTIEDDVKKLRGWDDDPIKICDKVFTIPELERGRDKVYFPSTAHPLFLTPNLTQVIVTLKGLKAMAEDPLYAEYAKLTAADIWEQLSNYAQNRIRTVLSELLPEDLSWYESLQKPDDDYFYSEYRCSVGRNIYMDCIKNDKQFFIEYNDENGAFILDHCRIVPGSLCDDHFDVVCTQGEFHLTCDRILRSGYTAEELL